mgnify:FL=1
MQKKVILPLMLAVPAAMPTLANIPLGFPKDGDWVKTNITSDDWVNEALNEVNCPVGTASVTATFKNLPKGKYLVRFANATNVELSVGGKLVEVADSESATTSKSFEFDGGTLELTLTGKNKSIGFQFKINCIVLEVAEEAYTDVLNAFNQIPAIADLNEVAADDDFQEAVDLRAARQDFINNATKYKGVSMTDVLENLKTMAAGNEGINEMTDSKKWIDLYKEYGLDKTPTDVLAAQQGWIAWAEEHNKAVDAENAIWKLYLDNVATRTTLLNEQGALMTNAQALKTAIEEFKVVDPALKAEYVTRINAYIAKLDEYKTSIETAYADPAGPDRRSLREVITFESQKTALETVYNELNTDFDNFKKDYTAYYNINFIQLTNLKNAYDAYVRFLTEVKGVKGYENVYDDLVYGKEGTFENPTADSKLGTANTTYDNTKNENQIEAVEGADAVYQAKLAAITAVIEGWKNLTTEFQGLIDDQNGNMTTAQGEAAKWDAKVAEYNKLTVPKHLEDQFDANLKAVTDAIAAFNEYIDAEYKKHTLDLESIDYKAKVDAVTDAIDAMDEFVAPMKTINTLLEKLEAAKTEVGKLAGGEVSGDDEGETTTVSIADRFNSTYEDLKVAILDLTLQEAEDETITGKIETQIQKYQADAEAYAANLIAANKAIASLVKSYTDLTTFLTDKIFDTYKEDTNTQLAGVKKTYTDSWETMFDTPIKSFRNDLYQAVLPAKNDQQSFEALRDVVAALTAAQAGNMSTDVFDAQKLEFANNGTLANWKFGSDRFGAFQKTLKAAQEAGVANADKINVDQLEDDFYDIWPNDINTATTPEEFGECDVKIKEMLDKLQIQIDKLKDYQATQDNYDALKANWDALLPSLQSLREYNENTSLEPALTYFADKVIGTNSDDSVDGTIGKDIFDLANELTKALNETKIVTDAEEKVLQDKIDAINADIKATRAAIELNNNTHNAQLDKEREERAHALDVIAQIDAKGAADGSADLEIMKQWKEELQSIIDNDIVNENIVVTNAYGAGESAAQDEAIMAAYKAIHEKIQSIEDQLNGDEYTQAVKDANALTTQNWATGYYDKLMDEWRKAIQDFNYYYYDLDNQGWSKFIHDAIERHQEEFSSHKDIDDLNADVLAYIAEQNAKPHVITPEEWKTWTDKADALSKVINDRVVELENEANALAQTYYNQQHAQAQNAVNDAKAALEAAGIAPEAYLAKANNHLSTAESIYAERYKGA